MNVETIIAAGGKSSRFNNDRDTQISPQNKLLYRISDTPVLALTLLSLSRSKYIKKFTIVSSIAPEIIKTYQAKYQFQQSVALVSPGDTRQESVYNGLQSLSQNTDIVIIHDAARPFINSQYIDTSVEEAYHHSAAVVAIPLYDTIKKGKAGFFEETSDRENLWAAQTPQTFCYNTILSAHHHARKNNIQATDDSMLVELLGIKPKIIEGHKHNIKITSREDIPLAEYLLSHLQLL